MSEQLVSKYINNSPAGKKKHIFSRLLDYFSTFIVSYLMFTIVYAIGARLPFVQAKSTAYVNAGNAITEFVTTTHLQNYNEGKTALLDIGVDAKQYIKNVTITSAYVHNVQIPVKAEDGHFDYVDVEIEQTLIFDQTNYPLDNPSFYCQKFKATSPGLDNYVYDGVDYKDDKATYQYLKVMNINQTMFVESDNADYVSRGGGVSRFVVLNSEMTEKLINRALKEETVDPVATSAFNTMFDSYIRGVQYFISDVEHNSQTYAGLNATFNAMYQELTKSIAVMYIIAYILGYILLNLIVSLISREWVTIGQKVMGLGVTDFKENEPTVWRMLLYHFVNSVLFFSSSIISLFFIGIFGVLSLQLFPGFSLLGLVIAILILNVLSFFMEFFGRVSHDLSTFVARIYIKDKNEFDVPVGIEASDDSEPEKQ